MSERRTIWRDATDGELAVDLVADFTIGDERHHSVWVGDRCVASVSEGAYSYHEALAHAAGLLLSMSMACAATAGQAQPEQS